MLSRCCSVFTGMQDGERAKVLNRERARMFDNFRHQRGGRMLNGARAGPTIFLFWNQCLTSQR